MFDQQPIEVKSLIDACLDTYVETKDKKWFEESERCLSWFLGQNDLGIPVCDCKTGGCGDGLERQKAFTLAEVLITLGIIGIVASMTIPILITKYQKQQYVTQLKKNVAIFDQALGLIAQEEGCPGDLSCTDLFKTIGGSHDSGPIGDALTAKIKTTKVCKSDLGCEAPIHYKYFNGNPSTSTVSNNSVNGSLYRFITIDGASVSIFNYNSDCVLGLGSIEPICASLTIDVNGLKGPNYYGRDVFSFYIAKNGNIAPNGSHKYGTSFYWWDGFTKSCVDTNQEGTMCAGRIIDEGWQMNY